MFRRNENLKHGKYNKWGGHIREITATSMGRTGVINKAGIDNKAFVIMLRGNLDEGVTNEIA